MKNLLLVTFILAFTFASCDYDHMLTPVPPNTGLLYNRITITDIEGIPAGVDFDTVRADITGFDWQVIATVEASYGGGELVLPLPTAFTASQLQEAGRVDARDYTGFWPATVSDTAARVAGLGDITAYKDGRRVGRIFLADLSGATGGAYIYYQYADRPFRLSGYNFTLPGQRDSYRYEASFRRGWNAYMNVDQGGTITLCTTAIPRGKPLGWRFERN